MGARKGLRLGVAQPADRVEADRCPLATPGGQIGEGPEIGFAFGQLDFERPHHPPADDYAHGAAGASALTGRLSQR